MSIVYGYKIILMLKASFDISISGKSPLVDISKEAFLRFYIKKYIFNVD